MQSPRSMASRLEVWPIDRLRPYARNPRTHSDEQIDQLCRSMEEFGFTNPILVDSDDGIIAGHGRLAAARRLGLDEVPVVVLDGLTEDQRKAYLIADNRLPENAGWDEAQLSEILAELDEAEFDLSVIGFMDDELSELLAGAEDEPPGAGAEDEIPDEPETPATRPGDVWRLGKHRLVCGDSTDADAVALALADEAPHLMVTDPPYGVDYDANWRNEADRANGEAIGGRAIGRVNNDDRCDWREAWALFPGDVAYVWHGGIHGHEVADSLLACGLELRAQIVWGKTRHVISRGHYHYQHEPCQPAGTMVSKVIKEGRWREESVIEQVPIETLKVGDKVVSYGNAKIFRRGHAITEIGSRSYTGNLHRTSVGDLSTQATAEHQFTVRFNPDRADAHILYLMRRGVRWRIGVCKMFNSRGFGLAVRLDQELGEEAWIVSAHPDMCSARVAEQVASCLYGIPTTHWELNRHVGSPWMQRKESDIEQIYRQIGLDHIAAGVTRLMADYGLSKSYPIITDREVGRFSRKQSRIVRACNLIPEIMQIPVPTNGEAFEWSDIESAEFESVSDIQVWSMDVDQTHHYVADGIVTHNCYYAVRRGRTGHWQGARDQTTLWTINHSRSETGHSTQKPVEAMRRPIENNSRRGDAVYEPFSGSGTTIIAAEQTGRRCLAIELDPVYVDVAILRWQQYTEQDAVLDADGRTFAEISEARLVETQTVAEGGGGVMTAGRPFDESANDPQYDVKRRA